MYNAEKPNLAELPSSAQLVKSTIIAAVAAAVILITIVLPAEYGIDPTRIGRLLGLTEMGEIKSQLTDEAEQDRQADEQEKSSLLDLFIPAAHAQEAEVWQDQVSFELTPGQGAEWKLVMGKDAQAEFRWFTSDGRVNYDLHGDGSGKSISYKKGRGVASETGTISAAFTGNHGWFFRNRTSTPLTVTLQLRGAYTDIKRTF
ncbi:transmembrane anchor protein [Tropicibacter sp. Alg240-R139]|uniref:transmembrane anchor protein n=1 Tax=Tropicibacter sp. Alg240-R139 TaxID=2305991 RepID=UPI0013E0EA37|nr:transmembrane anchor protein [Tropicibacter sp. Alg240-R139]